MVRTGLAVVAVALLGLFGYFFIRTPSDHTGAERAKEAAAQVGDTMVNEGVAGLVRARLATTFGVDGAAYLHVHFDGGTGQALVYGLLPPNVTPDDIAGVVRKIGGVKQVDVQALPRPAYLGAPAPAQPSGSGNPKP